MIFEDKYKIRIDDVNRKSEITNRALLAYLEDMATKHSDTVGQGPLDAKKGGFAWVLLDWRMQVVDRPKFNEVVVVKTWSRKVDKVTAYRDFEVLKEDGKRIAIATSRWCLIDANTRRILRISDEFMEKYESEPERMVFNDEISKMKEPNEFEGTCSYKATRSDIDSNGHVHNLNYLDIAYEALPEDVYGEEFNNVLIEYKKEIKYGEEVVCNYIKNGEKNIVVVSLNQKTNAVIELY